MKKALFIASFFLFVGTVSATTYSAASSDVSTEIKKDDDKKKKKTKKGKKGAKACTAEGKPSGGCCSGGVKTAPEKK